MRGGGFRDLGAEIFGVKGASQNLCYIFFLLTIFVRVNMNVSRGFSVRQMARRDSRMKSRRRERFSGPSRSASGCHGRGKS
jgi:hypothetical protein